MNAIYCDGGVIRVNPSPIGGTWAVRFVRDGEVIAERSGVITPIRPGLPAITNNLTELLAVVSGLSKLPWTWTGTVYSDSQVTLGRVFDGWKWAGVPDWLRHDYERERIRLANWDQITHVLLDGHPTKAQLLAGIGRHGYPVSEHNVWCDRECGKRAAEYMQQVPA
jgi:ribonuclease HI